MAGHRSTLNPCRSRIVIDAGDAYIELIEEFPCESREQLNKREGEVIRERECVNMAIPGRTQVEWVRDNKDRVKAVNAEWVRDNKDRIIARNKAYNEANKEHRKAYDEANKERRNQRDRARREKQRADK
jgi:hypothetical protein